MKVESSQNRIHMDYSGVQKLCHSECTDRVKVAYARWG